MRKISFLAKNAIIGLKQGYEGFAIRGRLFVYAVSCSVHLCPVDQADDSHDQVNGTLRKVYGIKMYIYIPTETISVMIHHTYCSRNRSSSKMVAIMPTLRIKLLWQVQLKMCFRAQSWKAAAEDML